MSSDKKVIVSKETLELMLANENPEYVGLVVGRALVAIFNNQTNEEQASNVTQKSNGVGFTGADAYSGSLTAKYFMKHGKLASWQVDRWTKLDKKGSSRLAKYAKQLNEIALMKQST